MKVSKGVRVLEVQGPMGLVYPTLIIDDKDVILVDTGFPLQFTKLKKSIVKEGFEISDITKIILTHHDFDHIGCITEIIRESPNVTLYAHTLEKPYIEGKNKPIKLKAIKQKFEDMNEVQKIFFKGFKDALENKYITIDEELHGGEVLGNTIKMHVIHTPGHTPGHIVLYLPDIQIVIAGDALNIVNRKLAGSEDEHTQDLALSKSSLKPLQDLEINTVICYHGGVYTGDIQQDLKDIIE